MKKMKLGSASGVIIKDLTNTHYWDIVWTGE